MALLYAMTMLSSFLGNSSLIYIVWKVPESRSLTSFMFVNMAVADLLVTVFMMPVQVNELYNDFHWAIPGTLGEISCRTIQYITKVTVMASILSLTFMAIDRFYVIKYPLESRTAWFRKSKYISSLIWILSLAFMSIMPVFYFLNVTDDFRCELSPLGDPEFSIRAVFIYLFLVSYLIPLIVTSILYGKTAREVWFRGIRGNLFTEAQQRKEAINKKRVIRMLAIIVVVFSLCWLPVQLMHVFYAVTIFREPLPVPTVVKNLAIWVGHANSAINPWLYIFLSSKMKLAFFQMLGKRSCRKRDEMQTKAKKLGENPIRLHRIK